MQTVEKLNNLERILAQSIKGQDHVIPRVSAVLKRAELGLSNPDRPKGNFLFLGPTGTGKTEICKAFTKTLFEDEKKLIRFDMSEYQTKEALESLIGDKTGWNGRLGEAIIKSEGSGVLLFDEMEKAHRDMLDIFLQMMDDARLTTGTGLCHDLRNYYIVLTSNVGADKLMNARRLNFSTIEKSIKMTLSQHGFRNEFIGRFNEVIVFKMLDYDTMREIATLNVSREVKRLSKVLSEKYNKNILLEPTPSIIDLTVMEGTNTRLGARPIRNFVETAMQNAVSNKILTGQIPQGRVTAHKSEFVIGEKLSLKTNIMNAEL